MKKLLIRLPILPLIILALWIKYPGDPIYLADILDPTY